MNLRSIFGGDVAALDPADARYVTGSPEDQKRARVEWHRQRFIAEVMRSNLEEIPRADLQQLRFAFEDTRTREFYVARRDGLIDLSYTNAVAYYFDSSGLPVLLEKPHGPKNRGELEAQQAEREQRRNAPKRRPAWMDQPRR